MNELILSNNRSHMASAVAYCPGHGIAELHICAKNLGCLPHVHRTVGPVHSRTFYPGVLHAGFLWHLICLHHVNASVPARMDLNLDVDSQKMPFLGTNRPLTLQIALLTASLFRYGAALSARLAGKSQPSDSSDGHSQRSWKVICPRLP